MPGAHEMPLVLGQEVVGKCLQRDELVRTGIDIGVHAPCRLDDDHIQLVFAFTEDDIGSTRICQIRGLAEKNHATPPAWQMICHSRGETGWTDRREFFTSTISESRSSDRI